MMKKNQYDFYVKYKEQVQKDNEDGAIKAGIQWIYSLDQKLTSLMFKEIYMLSCKKEKNLLDYLHQDYKNLNIESVRNISRGTRDALERMEGGKVAPQPPEAPNPNPNLPHNPRISFTRGIRSQLVYLFTIISVFLVGALKVKSEKTGDVEFGVEETALAVIGALWALLFGIIFIHFCRAP